MQIYLYVVKTTLSMYLSPRPRKGYNYYVVVHGKRCKDDVSQKTDLYIGRLDNRSYEEVKNIYQEILKLNCKKVRDQFISTIIELGFPPHIIISINKSLDFGDAAAYYRAAELLNIPEIIEDEIYKGGGPHGGKLITIMAICHSLNPTSKHDMINWYAETALPYITDISIEKMADHNLYSVMRYLSTECVDRIENRIVKELVNKYNISLKSCIYDITSTYFYGQISELIKRGYSRDKLPHLPQINIGLAITSDHGFPIKSWVHEGNSTDVKNFPSDATKLKDLFSEENITLVFDRGNLSKDNINVIEKMEYAFVCGLKKSETEVKNHIKMAMKNNNFEAIKETKDEEGKKWVVYGSLLKGTLYGKERAIGVFFSELQEEIKKRHRREKIKKAIEELKELQSKTGAKKYSHDKVVVKISEIVKGVKKYIEYHISDHPERNTIEYTLHDDAGVDGRKIRWIRAHMQNLKKETTYRLLSLDEIRKRAKEIRHGGSKCCRYRTSTIRSYSTFTFEILENKIVQSSELDGYYAVMSSYTGVSLKDLCDIDSGREEVERAFRTIKNPLKVRPVRHRKPEMIRAHVYICVLGFFIRKMIVYLLKSANVGLSYREALLELRRIKLILLSEEGDSVVKTLTALSEKQKSILDTMEVNWKLYQ